MPINVVRRSGRYPVTPWSDQRLYRPFVRTAIALALSLGFTTGAWVLAWSASGRVVGMAWATYLQPHGVAQLFGWAGLFVMGIAMHVVPRFRGNAAVRFPWPQRSMLGLVLLGIGLRAAGQVGHELRASAPLLVASGVALLAGILIFAATLAEVLRGGRPSGSPLERWLWSGLAWAVAAALLHFFIVVQMAIGARFVAPAGLNRAFVLAATFGFIMHFLLGVSLRASAGFLGLRPRRARLEKSAYLAVEAGLLLQVIAAVTGAPAWRSGAGGELLLATGLLLFVGALRVLERPAAPRAATALAFVRFAWFLIAAYVWLLVGALMLTGEAGAALEWWHWPIRGANAVLHTVTLGFISMTIIGFASRVLPLFEGRVLRRGWLLDVAFVALNAGTALRLATSFLGAPLEAHGLALSGALGLLAVVAFAIAVWPLLGNDRGLTSIAAMQRLEIVVLPARPSAATERMGVDR